MDNETKKQFSTFAGKLQEVTEQKAKTTTGWQKAAWILACIACAVAGYFLSACTMTQARQAAELHNVYHYVTGTECKLAQPEPTFKNVVIPAEFTK